MRRTRLYIFVGFGLLLIAVCTALLWREHAQAPANNSKSTSQPPATSPAFNTAQYSTTDPASPWVVVNKQHPLNPLQYAPTDLTNVGSGQFLRAEAATQLAKMIADAKTVGLTITADSGYRSYATQVSVYNNEVKTNGQTVADSQSARPGYSEHQTGWSIDIGTPGCHIADCFGATPAGTWAAANGYKYGYIVRYTPPETAVTGYRAESWHFRYVGPDLAGEMNKQGIATLEQFFNISGGPAYKN